MLIRGSTLSPLLFNIDICELLFVNITSNNMNYADDITPYECDQPCDNLIRNLELTVDKISSWFEYNSLEVVLDASKCIFSLLSYQHTLINING